MLREELNDKAQKEFDQLQEEMWKELSAVKGTNGKALDESTTYQVMIIQQKYFPLFDALFTEENMRKEK